MRKTRSSEEQIIEILKGGERGRKVADVCREHGISPDTYYRWRRKYGGMSVPDAKRLKRTSRARIGASRRSSRTSTTFARARP